LYHKNRETCGGRKSLVVYSSMLLRVFATVPRCTKVVTRAKKEEPAWDPDDQHRINENKNWRAGQPEEDAWDIDKERDAVRYKRESLEYMLCLKSYDKEEDKDKEPDCDDNND
jgi:hypothetical protein